MARRRRGSRQKTAPRWSCATAPINPARQQAHPMTDDGSRRAAEAVADLARARKAAQSEHISEAEERRRHLVEPKIVTVYQNDPARTLKALKEALPYHDLIGTYTQQDIDHSKVFQDVAAYTTAIFGAQHVRQATALACRTALAERGVAHLAEEGWLGSQGPASWMRQ